jgi:hypothetical protein
LLLIAVPGGIEDYSHSINTASTDDERRRIGERYGIRVVTGMSRRTRACPPVCPSTEQPFGPPTQVRHRHRKTMH